MKKTLMAIAFLLSVTLYAQQPKELTVYYNNVPVITGENRNVVCEISVYNDGSLSTLDELTADISGVALDALKRVRLVYSGASSCILSRTNSWEMGEHFRRWGGGQKLYDNERFVKDVCEIVPSAEGHLVFKADRKLLRGWNYFYISLNADPEKLELGQSFELMVSEVKVSGASREFVTKGEPLFRFGASVRTHGDDGVDYYRIPGLVTTNEGTLIAVYDVRYLTEFDLQADIDVAISRSFDGGRTWEDMQIIMDMGEWGDLPKCQNGVGDPSILVDEKTGEIFVVAAWTHGIGNDRAWWNVGQGFEPGETAQLMIVSSKDDGKTWSEPRNITKQIKQEDWYFTFQGPGRGICMEDGTLVFPFQHQEPKDRIPCSGIIYSKDHGQTWHIHNHPIERTTESQVVEIEPGVLMLNMRNDRRSGRLVYITKDFGKTWWEHPSSGRLQEPVCMASVLNIRAEDNVFGQDILLFSNPNTKDGRHHMTIKASLDKGHTWLEANQLMIDAEKSMGYSCLTLIDRETVGIFYESSQAQLAFQSIKLKDIIKTMDTGCKVENLVQIDGTKGFAQGVSGHYSAVVKNSLVLAGGCNFVDNSLEQGAKKEFFDDIYKCTDGVWKKIGSLPEKSAYGAYFDVNDKLVIAGGNGGAASRKVLSIDAKGDEAVITELAELPVTFEQGGFFQYKGVLYLAGGLADGKASDVIYAYNTKTPKNGWKEVGKLPHALVQPVFFVLDGKAYFYGGFDPAKSETVNKGYCADIKTFDWELVDDEIPYTFVGSAVVESEGKVYAVGGVDTKVFNAALKYDAKQLVAYLHQPVGWYNFRQSLLQYNVEAKTWEPIATDGRLALAGATVSQNKGVIYVSGGELKPRVRTPYVISVKL